MTFAPPWVTVLASPQELERFREDPEEQSASGAVELRLDLWPEPPRLGDLANLPIPAIVTWRRGNRGEPERLRFLKDLLAGKAGPIWLDFDAEDPAVHRGLSVATHRPDDVKVLMSRHLTREMTDAALRGAARDLVRPGVDAAKLVLADGGARGTAQALRIAPELSGKIPFIVFCAGIGGTASRFIARASGQPWGYGRLRGAPGVVPGQPAVADIATRYGGGPGPEGPVHLVLGRNVSRSLTPGFHSRVLAEGDDPARWLDLSLEDPDGLDTIAPESPWSPRALAVTGPWKTWGRRQGRAGAPGEERHPSWNTLVRHERTWRGWNTDVPALIECLERHEVPAEAPTLIVGAGGTAQPIALELARRGAPVWILRQRTKPLPQALAEATVVEVGPDAIPDATVIINTTGAGKTAADRLPWPIETFRGTHAVEFLYEPRETEFLARATAAGARSIGGLEIFIAQARRQVEIFTGRQLSAAAATKIADAAFAELERDRPEGAS